VPGYERAELSAELRIVPSPTSEEAPREQIEAAKQAASESGLAREAGPEITVLAGDRAEVLEALFEAMRASLDAGARSIEVKVEAEADAERFD
jgi:uncharacterized protein YqgV (UPF0045/DUF77 family)